ncbi:MAG: hypothetical protein U9N86_10840 [Bacteroidota bacterium]|nr:hypothetical protein [Bacteroidota bacterium]
MIILKDDTVKMAGIKPEMVVGLMLVQQVYSLVEVSCVITAGTEEFYLDGTRIHMKGSLHPQGYALDFRSRDIPKNDLDNFCDELQEMLKSEYQVIKHNTHIHVEFDLK